MTLKFAPGTGWEYGVSIDVLGCVACDDQREQLDEAIQRYVTGPLGHGGHALWGHRRQPPRRALCQSRDG